MRRRLYFVLPDVQTARQAVDELLLDRIEERRIHALARDDIPLDGLPEATLFERSDLVHGMELGLVVGGATGAVAGLVALWLHPLTIVTGGGLVLAIALVGAVIGTWASGMIATSVPNTRLKMFDRDLEAGRILLMVDVPVERKDEVTRMIKRHHPEAGARGPEPTIPAFP